MHPLGSTYNLSLKYVCNPFSWFCVHASILTITRDHKIVHLKCTNIWAWVKIVTNMLEGLIKNPKPSYIYVRFIPSQSHLTNSRSTILILGSKIASIPKHPRFLVIPISIMKSMCRSLCKRRLLET